MNLFGPPEGDAQAPYRISTDASAVRDFVPSSLQCLLYHGDCRDLLRALPDNSVQLIVTSPPYNIGKEYEARETLEAYKALQQDVIGECVRVVRPEGSICWEVGNHIVGSAEILPLDIVLHGIFASHGLHLRNRIVWHFEHGLHCKKRFSGRYEVIMWYTKTDEYHFDLDPVRVPQKYPGKRHFKGPKAGELSGNPLGKNPADVWQAESEEDGSLPDFWVFPNVKHNHREKTPHPCQFPIELVDRLVLAMTEPGDIVMDPFAGVSSSLAAAVLRDRRACGAELVQEYVDISRDRIEQAFAGTLPVRPAGQAVYKPKREKVARLPLEFQEARQSTSE